MALRTKTIEFATTTDIATLAAATSRDKTLNVYIPESSITFKSVTLQCWVRDNSTASSNLLTPILGIAPTLGGTYSEVTLSNPPGQTGESQSFFLQRDVTSWFTTNWSGTNMALGVRFRCTGMITADHYFRLVVTYEYQDTSGTHIKTVRIPIESTRRHATTTWQTLGGATAIPALTGGFLPENGVVIRQAFLDLWGNENPGTSATDVTLSIRVNGGTQRDIYFAEQGFTGSGLHFRTGYDITSEDTYGSPRSLELFVATTTNRFARTGGMLVVTYEYTVSGTTTVLNSLMLGGVDTIGQIPGTTSADAESWGRNIYIEEPGTITLVNSAVCLFAQSPTPGSGTGTLNVAVGNQGTYTPYTMSITNSFELGPHSLVHRIDAGGQNGTAFETLRRGKNAYELRIFAAVSNNWWNLTGFILLNYTSGVATQGVGAHAQSRYNLIAGSTATPAISRTVTGAALTLGTDETNYWLTGAMPEINIDHQGTVAAYAYAMSIERAGDEGEGEGWEPIFAGMTISDIERNCCIRIYSSARSTFRRYPADLDTSRLDVTTSRSWRLDTPVACYTAWGFWATFHTITFTVSGNITNSNGGTVNIALYREDTGERMLETSRTGNGSYSFTWYDNTENVFVEAYEDDDYKGRSANGTAS